MTDATVRIAGLGARKGVATAQVLAAIDAALAAHGLSRDRLTALAAVPAKRREPAFRQAAEGLGLPLLIPETEAFEGARPGLLTRSAASLAATGFGSASEAAALAAAGPGGRLLGPRIASGAATCAIAERK